MTLQDDIARAWFQPSVPTDAPHERARPAGARQDAGSPATAAQGDGGRPAVDGGNAGPLTTRVAGELPLDETRTFAPRSPVVAPAAERVEVTQPYIPAIREHEPSFAKRPHPEAPASAEPATPPAPTPVPTPDDAPGAVTAPTAPVAAPRKETPTEQSTATSSPARPPKRRSLARRVVRTIIGPDLLRKDPVTKKK